MEKMIKGYVESCLLVRARIDELTEQKNSLNAQGDISAIDELDLERRIRLLYCEYEQMQEVISVLVSYTRRRDRSAET